MMLCVLPQRFRFVAILLAVTGAVVTACSTPTAAQGYPNRHVTLVVPFAAGGATDVLGRLLGHQLSAALGQSVVIENRPGAAGGTGSAAVAKSPPDGYVILLGTVSTHGINPALYSRLSYDADKDFIPISYIADVPNVLVVSPKRVQATTIQGLVAEAKASSSGLTMASSGVGSSIHLSGELFKIGAKVNMVHVPYRGSGPAINDMLVGSVDLMFDNLPSALPQIQAGNLRALAVTSLTRSDSLPDIPTIAETVIPGFEAVAWFALYAPAGTPAAVIGRLRTATADVLAKSEFTERLKSLGATARVMSEQALSRFLGEERKKWAEVVRTAGAKVD